AASSIFHDFCTTAAVEIPAVIVSVDYRLAPEHRLPAAYDDCLDALHWINSSNEDWLTKYADFSSCFLMGTSAGGNIAYHVGLRAAACVEDLTRLKIRGLISHHPYFGGASRTQSETRLAINKTLPLSANDLMWELALPVGVDRDHEYCNPMVGGGPSEIWDEIRVGWRVLVIGCDGDPLMDRQVELVKVLGEKGVKVVVNIGSYYDQSRDMSDQTTDPYAYIGMVRNPDGSVTRNPLRIPNTPATYDPTLPSPAFTKDIPINQSSNTWLRIFLPRETHDSPSPAKLPLVVYYHGGGFVLCSAASSMFHDFCTTAAVEIPAVIVSVEYRLAPEHRLPAAYDDCLEALHWLASSNDEWLTKYADFSSCFLMGSSAGGNIAYHVGLRAAKCVDDLTRLKIEGLILHHAYFGGASRTQSETRLAINKTLPLRVNDLMWELGLPVGVDRDHEYCNPTVGGGPSGIWDEIRVLGWRVLVIGCDGDPLIDRQVELVKALEGKGVNVVGKFGEGDYHGVEIMEPAKAGPLCVVIKEFITA
ncbi:hypothetical protein RJ639_027869, partial [Escallonia herrerae]